MHDKAKALAFLVFCKWFKMIDLVIHRNKLNFFFRMQNPTWLCCLPRKGSMESIKTRTKIKQTLFLGLSVDERGVWPFVVETPSSSPCLGAISSS